KIILHRYLQATEYFIIELVRISVQPYCRNKQGYYQGNYKNNCNDHPDVAKADIFLHAKNEYLYKWKYKQQQNNKKANTKKHIKGNGLRLLPVIFSSHCTSQY